MLDIAEYVDPNALKVVAKSWVAISKSLIYSKSMVEYGPSGDFAAQESHVLVN
ncbi:MAG: hypothetical protein J7L19_02870 [Dehalococcoidia bacterium]|nr:hypothetical protein [Dehalococcoidia bacterium]